MAGSTLKAFVERFYRLVAPAFKMDLHAAMEQWDRAFVIQLLNDGWRRAAMDTNGLTLLGKATLTSGQATYNLDAAVLSTASGYSPVNTLLRVDLYKVLTDPPYVSLEPQYAPDLVVASGAIDNGTPTACAWYHAKHQSTEGNLELRLYPAPNWTLASGLHVIASVLPIEITDETAEPDCQGEIAHMGLWDALYQATGQPRFMASYNNSKRLVAISGVASQPVTKRHAFRGRGGKWNPKLLTS